VTHTNAPLAVEGRRRLVDRCRTRPALGLNHRRFIDPDGDSNREPRKIIARRPGHMIHIDVKKVGRIPQGGGWRAHGRGSDQAKMAARSKRRTKRGGYVCLHSAIDGYSRLAYTEGCLTRTPRPRSRLCTVLVPGSPLTASPESSES
jgi:hypothetical protein